MRIDERGNIRSDTLFGEIFIGTVGSAFVIRAPTCFISHEIIEACNGKEWISKEVDRGREQVHTGGQGIDRAQAATRD